MFSGAEGYERFMGRWSRRLAPLLVQFAEVREGDSVLDVGSGTGALSVAAAAVPSVRVTGVEPSEAFVQYAREHAGPAVRFEVGDAQRLPFPDASFDRTLSLLVLNFVPDPSAALREMVRVTRPGGVVAAAVWDYGGGMQMLRLFWDEAVALAPQDASRDEARMPLTTRDGLADLWRAHGLQHVEAQALTIDMGFESFDDYWQPLLCGQGPAGAYVSSLAETARRALQSKLRERLPTDGAFTLRARAWVVRGTVT
jgi:SAM-dependent methyltransferase